MEKKYEKEIRAAKKAAAQMGKRFEALDLKPFEFQGDEDALVETNEKKDKHDAQES